MQVGWGAGLTFSPSTTNRYVAAKSQQQHALLWGAPAAESFTRSGKRAQAASNISRLSMWSYYFIPCVIAWSMGNAISQSPWSEEEHDSRACL